MIGRVIVLVSGLATAGAGSQALAPYRVDGDAIDAPLAGLRGDAARGREVALGRESNCLLCHAVPDPGGRPTGNIAPPLAAWAPGFRRGSSA